MTAIVIELPATRRRRNRGPASRHPAAAPARPVDLAAYRRARAARRSPRRDLTEHDDEEEGDGEGGDWAERAHRVIDAAEELLAAGRAAEVVEFCGLATRCLDRSAADLDDPGTLCGLTERLGDLRVRAGGCG
jgi:hypothetical protein